MTITSMEYKIRQFLAEAGAGFDDGGEESVNIHLLKFFQQEYGLNVMALLEEEWLNEQLERDFTSDDFDDLRGRIDEDHHEDYDRDVDVILGR